MKRICSAVRAADGILSDGVGTENMGMFGDGFLISCVLKSRAARRTRILFLGLRPSAARHFGFPSMLSVSAYT